MNRSGPVASAHVFTFRSLRDAGRSLRRGRAHAARISGLRFARVIFVGSRRSEAIAPGLIDPRRQLAMCVWDDEQALERFRERSPVAHAWRARTEHYCEVRMTPFRAIGTYMGEAPLAGLEAQSPPAGPVALMTFANMPVRGLPYFYAGLARTLPVLHASEGLIAATGGPERLGRGGMTFTIWGSLPAALAYSYRRQPHRGLVKNVREHDRFIDSMFLRLEPYRAQGEWFPWSRFAPAFDAFVRAVAAMPSTPAPARAAATRPRPAAPSRTA